MRAPDHDAGTGGEPAAPAPAAPAAPAEGAPDGGQPPAAPADADGAGDGNDASLMGGAGTTKPADPAGTEGEGDSAEGETSDADGGEPDEVPEAYDLALPEGVEMDAALLDEATPVLKELGLGNAAANKLVPLVGKVQEAILTRQTDAHAAMAADWAKTAKADPEIGGKNFDASMSNVAKVFDRYGVGQDSEFRQLLNETKLGNHPEMIRIFSKIGADLAEDTQFVAAGAIPATKPDRAEILYPNDQPKTKVK